MCAFMYSCVCVFVYAFLLLWKCGNVEIKNKGATYQSTNAPFYLTVPLTVVILLRSNFTFGTVKVE